MPLHVGVPYQQVLRASAALPAAGAWDATPTEVFVSGAAHLTFHLAYTRGAAGGAFDFQCWYSPYSVAANVPTGAEEWLAMALYAPGLVAAGVDSQSREQREYVTYQATAAPVEAIEFGPVNVGGTVERVRVRARESGAVGNPGTLQIELTAR